MDRSTPWIGRRAFAGRCLAAGVSLAGWVALAFFYAARKEYTFSLVPTQEGESPVDPATLSLQFMVRDIDVLRAELGERGIAFERCLTSYELTGELVRDQRSSPASG